MNRISIALLIVLLLVGVTACKKKNPIDNPTTKNPTKVEKLAKVWIMKHIEMNGSLVTDDGKTPYEFKTDGTFHDDRDASGNWKYTGQWTFNNDSTAVNVFVGKPNEQLWVLDSLKEDKLEVDHTDASGNKFHFGFIPE